MKFDALVQQLGIWIAYRYSFRDGRLHKAATNRKQIYTGQDNSTDLHIWILLPTYITSGESKVAVVKNMTTILWILGRNVVYK